MVTTVDNLKHLGKPFFYPVETTEGFLPETKLSECTHVLSRSPDTFYNPLTYGRVKELIEHKRDILKRFGGLLAHCTIIEVGKIYKGSLKLPKGTEAIEIYDLNKDGSQAINYCHRFQRNKGQFGVEIIPFANELRSPDNRVEITDIVPKDIMLERAFAPTEKKNDI